MNGRTFSQNRMTRPYIYVLMLSNLEVQHHQLPEQVHVVQVSYHLHSPLWLYGPCLLTGKGLCLPCVMRRNPVERPNE